jgi:CarD family transcriptional regulator
MEFAVGDNVVVPGCGVGRIEAVEKKELGEGVRVELFRIALACEEVRVWIPVGRLEEKGVRAVMDVEHAERALALIGEQEAPETRKNWNQRRRRYDEMLLSNSPTMMARLLGELSAVRADKPLTFTEKRLFRQVWGLLEAELSAALHVDRAEAAARMSAITAPESAAA